MKATFTIDYVTIITGKGQGAILANIEEYLRDEILNYRQYRQKKIITLLKIDFV
nr:hypothetical protein [Mycoplasmopsis bovis]